MKRQGEALVALPNRAWQAARPFRAASGRPRQFCQRLVGCAQAAKYVTLTAHSSSAWRQAGGKMGGVEWDGHTVTLLQSTRGRRGGQVV